MAPLDDKLNEMVSHLIENQWLLPYDGSDDGAFVLATLFRCGELDAWRASSSQSQYYSKSPVLLVELGSFPLDVCHLCCYCVTEKILEHPLIWIFSLFL
jgi:hypothetical protein